MSQLLLVSAAPARLDVPLHLFGALRGWDAFLISQKGGSRRRRAPLSLIWLLAPGFFVFCAAPEGALRCVNRMLMANYAGAPHPLCAPRNHPFSRPSAGLFRMRNSWCRAMINSAGYSCSGFAPKLRRITRGVGRRRQSMKRFAPN